MDKTYVIGNMNLSKEQEEKFCKIQTDSMSNEALAYEIAEKKLRIEEEYWDSKDDDIVKTWEKDIDCYQKIYKDRTGKEPPSLEWKDGSWMDKEGKIYKLN